MPKHQYENNALTNCETKKVDPINNCFTSHSFVTSLIIMQILKTKLADAFAHMSPNIHKKGSSLTKNHDTAKSSGDEDSSTTLLTLLENSFLFDETFHESNTSILLSSTYHLSASSLPLLVTPSTKKSVGVRFNEAKNKYHSPNFVLEDLKSWREDIWYNQEECRHFKESTQFLCESLRRSKSSYGAILQRVYSKAYRISSSSDNSDSNQQLLLKDHVALTNILKRSTGKLGLERKITLSVLRHIMAKKIAIYDVVIRGKGVVVDDDDDDDEAEQIRKACEDRSRSSRLFALYLAKALAASIEEEEESQNCAFARNR
jgi:hypothetical protein